MAPPSGPTGGVRVGAARPGGGFAAPPGRKVAALLPLTGANAEIGQALQKATQLALTDAGGPPIDVLDTTGTPDGAAAAAKQAIAGGAGLLLGPLTAAETRAVAPVAGAAGVGVLAFTSDASQGRPGVWPLGVTPAQQVHRLVAAAEAQGHTPVAALLPENDLGHALADALTQTASGAGLPPPTIETYGGSFGSINVATRAVSGYASRRGPMDAEIKKAREQGDAEGRKQAAEIAKRAVPAAPFGALLLGETGEKLSEVMSLLPYYDIDPPQVKLMGPALWGSPAALRGSGGGLRGAWFAAPDPATREAFVDRYTAAFGAAPPSVADLAYDAAAIARAVAPIGFSSAALSRPEGFAGSDGTLVLGPDGSVRRGLALFEIGGGGAQMIEPAPSPGT